MRAVFKEDSETYFLDNDFPIPTIKKNEVLVEVKACGLPDILNQIQEAVLKKAEPNRFAVGTDIAGIVKQVGYEVTSFTHGNEVVGIIPLDRNESGCAEFAVLDEFDLTTKPNGVSFVDAAACIGNAVKAYTALHYLGRLRCGETVLVMDGASSFGSVVIQLAQHWGAKVMCTASSEDEKLYLAGVEPELASIIDLQNHRINNLRNICLEETGSLGVDIMIDNDGDEEFDNNSKDTATPTKHQIISSLAVGGRWITSNPNLQLDPPNSRMLFLKGATLAFLFSQAWSLSSLHQGRYQHILNDVMEKLSNGIIRPNIHHTVPFESTLEALNHLRENRVGKIVATF